MSGNVHQVKYIFFHFGMHFRVEIMRMDIMDLVKFYECTLLQFISWPIYFIRLISFEYTYYIPIIPLNINYIYAIKDLTRQITNCIYANMYILKKHCVILVKS